MEADISIDPQRLCLKAVKTLHQLYVRRTRGVLDHLGHRSHRVDAGLRTDVRSTSYSGDP